MWKTLQIQNTSSHQQGKEARSRWWASCRGLASQSGLLSAGMHTFVLEGYYLTIYNVSDPTQTPQFLCCVTTKVGVPRVGVRAVRLSMRSICL